MEWRLLLENGGVWAKVLECKYMGNGFGGDKINKFSSLWWRDVHFLNKEEGSYGNYWFENNLVRDVGD